MDLESVDHDQAESKFWDSSLPVRAFSFPTGLTELTYFRTGMIHLPDYRALDISMGDTGIWIPATPHLIQGQVERWASLSQVSSINIPGYWYHKPGSIVMKNTPASPGEKVILHFHGGAYIVDTAHPSGMNNPVLTGFLKHSTTIRRALSVEYRLSSSAPYPVEGQFPAALIDGVAGYDYLVKELGFNPRDIVIMGDSAAGHLVLSLTRYIVENPDVFPGKPGGLISAYPWSDMSESHNLPTNSALKFAEQDILGPLYDDVLLYATISFIGPHSPDLNPYLSPGSRNPAMDPLVSFKGFPPTFLCVGGYERLKDQVHVVRDRMIRDMGVESVRYEEPENAIHGFLGLGPHDPERTDVLKKIAKWVSELS